MGCQGRWASRRHSVDPPRQFRGAWTPRLSHETSERSFIDRYLIESLIKIVIEYLHMYKVKSLSYDSSIVATRADEKIILLLSCTFN